MRLAVLIDADSLYLRDLHRAAGGRHEIVPISFKRLRAEVSTDGSQIVATEHGPLTAFDAVLVRTMPPGSLEQIVFRMDALARLEAAGVAVVNSAKAIEAAVDKYLASAKLAAAGLPTPRTIVCQRADDALAAWHELGEDAVVKPLFGSEGRGITRLTDEALAGRAFKLLEGLGAVIYLQQFIEHGGSDLRLLVVGRRVLAMRRRNPADWRTNVSRGATTEPVDVTAELGDLATRSAAAIGASLAGVDVVADAAGKLYVLEVNAVPGWKALSATCGVDVAELVIEHLADVRRGAT